MRKECDGVREDYELLLLTPLYIFMAKTRVVDTGAGHFLAEFSGWNNGKGNANANTKKY
jgi:hypothetical protein